MAYIPRLADARLDEVLASFPATLLVGPRASGKTTSARRLASLVVELDDPPQAAPFRADPGAALRAMLRRGRGDGPVLLDEWQEVPEVLGAVKREVDKGAPPGSILMTGSVRPALTTESWPGTGRLIHVGIYPMSVLERQGGGRRSSTFLDRLFAGTLAELPLPSALPDLAGYADLAVAGGYPPTITLGGPARRTWLESYVDQIVQRDIPELGEIRDPTSFRRLLRAIAEHTAGLVRETELAAAADVNVKTVRRSERMLEDLWIVESLGAWHSSRISRLVKTRKRYVIDSGLGASLLGVSEETLMTHGSVLGRLLDTFVVSQLRPLIAVRPDMRLWHLRQFDGRREVDVVIEDAAGRIAGVEIKATAAPSSDDARHLAWLRDQVGDRFAAGVVLHTGPAAFTLGERISAVPIAAFWSSGDANG